MTQRKPKNRDYLKARERAKMFEKQKTRKVPDFENMEAVQKDSKTWVLKPKAKPDGSEQ